MQRGAPLLIEQQRGEDLHARAVVPVHALARLRGIDAAQREDYPALTELLCDTWYLKPDTDRDLAMKLAEADLGSSGSHHWP